MRSCKINKTSSWGKNAIAESQRLKVSTKASQLDLNKPNLKNIWNCKSL